MMVKKCLFVFSWVLLATVLTVGQVKAWNYPVESGYEEVPTIGTQELYEKYKSNAGTIVDVRSKIEYKTAHIKGAVHIPLSNKKFITLLKKQVAGKTDQPLFFYCNGTTCLKAPASAEDAIDEGLPNSYAYYGGLPGWAEAHPEETILRGKPVSADNQLIPKSEFKKKCLSFEDFKKTIASDPKALIVDVRDHIQKSGNLPGLTKKVLSIPLDNFIPNFVLKKRNQDKNLYIFDQVGKQVQSLEYELIESGYVNYWFLNKGATKVLGKQSYK